VNTSESASQAGGVRDLGVEHGYGDHMATPPVLSPEQRTAALAKAAEARTARAELKTRLKMGSLTLAEALASVDSTVGKLKVVSLLESLPGVGKVKARKIMEDIGIADNRRVQGLGAQQKASLLDQLGK
jgi:DNA uptake protein ComE-like DNA-binding protein